MESVWPGPLKIVYLLAPSITKSKPFSDFILLYFKMFIPVGLKDITVDKVSK
jgi:hypothetical protein